MSIDGKALARDIEAVLKNDIAACKRVPVLGILMIDPTPETESFVRIKKKKAQELGVTVIETELKAEAQEEEVVAALEDLVARSDGVVLQQPIPGHLNVDVLCNRIPPIKDIDGLHTKSVHLSPVAGAVQEILKKYSVETEGVSAVVIGSGNLVGKPVATLLQKLGADVSIMTKETGIDAEILSQAKIVVSGAGSPRLITKNMVNKEMVLIDAGTSESGGSLVGDVDPECYEHVALISPVPGGVGPLTVISLFKNLIKSASCSS